MSTTPPRLILASGSPRRGDLLTAAGYDYQRVIAAFDDTHIDWHWAGTSPARLCEVLAWLKATSVLDAGHTGLILAADTVAVCDEQILGKPRDRSNAREMISKMQGRAHDVITAVALIDSRSGAHLLWHDVATVTIGRLRDEAIEEYLESGLWVGKAGGYNLAEMEAAWTIRVEGDPTTVIGLPMQQLGEMMDRLTARVPVERKSNDTRI